MGLKRGAWLLLLASAVAAVATDWLRAPPAHANGRMPGATEFRVGMSDPRHLIARATYGLVQSFDGGASWEWICEQAIDVVGEADPPMALTADGKLILLPPTGGVLISRDHGCTWAEAPPPLQGVKAVDLTSDPSDPAHVLIVTSTIDEIDDAGLVSYSNVLIETRNDAASWQQAGSLPSDFKVETVEIAPSDPRRIYVSGTASESPLIGVIERSDDGGASWERTTVELPPTSGSLFISAVDPGDPDRLWIRVPAQGDRFGLLPASLLISTDKGATFAMLAATRMGMLGFALSPDGAQLAYGGPFDGLFVGPADGSGPFARVAGVQVRCLRWNAGGLYACGSEPQDPFSVGLSVDDGATFEPIYRLRETCPQQCADDTSFGSSCRAAWSGVAPRLAADGASCTVPWASIPPPSAGAGAADAGSRDASVQAEGGTLQDSGAPDAAMPPEAGAPAQVPPRGRGGSCSAAPVHGHATGPLLSWLAACALFGARATRRRSYIRTA